MRATRYMPLSGFCCCGKYIAILPSVSRPYCLTTPTTPTMVKGFFGIEPQVLADGIVVRPEALGELFVDDHHLRLVGRVVLREEPASAQRESPWSENSPCWRCADPPAIPGRAAACSPPR